PMSIGPPPGLKFYAAAGAPPVLVLLRVRAAMPPKAAAEAPEARRAPVSLDVAVRPAPAIRDPHKRGSRQRADQLRQVEPPHLRAVQAGAGRIEPAPADGDAEHAIRPRCVAQGSTSRVRRGTFASARPPDASRAGPPDGAVPRPRITGAGEPG